MNQKGIPETYALKGGTQGWKSAGYPMEGSSAVPAGNDALPNPPVISSNNAAPQNY
jgi:3-mercaptopyruvate sulfurtransferase SseA